MAVMTRVCVFNACICGMCKDQFWSHVVTSIFHETF